MVTKYGAYIVDKTACVHLEGTTWSAEASTLRFPVGQWPGKILLCDPMGDDLLLGHAQALHDGSAHIYESLQATEPCTLTVLKD